MPRGHRREPNPSLQLRPARCPEDDVRGSFAAEPCIHAPLSAALFAAVLFTALLGCTEKPAPKPLLSARKAHTTYLTKKVAAPAERYDDLTPADWLEVFEYESGSLHLRGYRAYPAMKGLEKGGRVPGLLYLHGGFALAKQDVIDVIAFLRAGFAVYAPALRAENGNPGHYELFYGELDDGLAALRAMQSDPGIDTQRTFVLGHSAGGVLSSLMSLDPDLYLPETASVGGLYDARVFSFLDVPFADDDEERRLRLLLPNLRQMKRRHWACVGEDDSALDPTRLAEAEARKHQLPLVVEVVPGDHTASLGPCVQKYLERALAFARAEQPQDSPQR